MRDDNRTSRPIHQRWLCLPGGAGTWFQRAGLAKGFSEVRIQDADAFLHSSKYIRNNPLARHLATDASQYPYSSAYEGFELDPAPQGLKPFSQSSLRRHGLKPCPDTKQ